MIRPPKIEMEVAIARAARGDSAQDTLDRYLGKHGITSLAEANKRILEGWKPGKTPGLGQKSVALLKRAIQYSAEEHLQTVDAVEALMACMLDGSQRGRSLMLELATYFVVAGDYGRSAAAPIADEIVDELLAPAEEN
jgi:hypothetical protein